MLCKNCCGFSGGAQTGISMDTLNCEKELKFKIPLNYFSEMRNYQILYNY